MSHVDRFENSPQQEGRQRSKSRSKPMSVDSRPPWNNDTYIEGYEDVDEKGKFRKRTSAFPKSVDNHEELSKNWTESLREQHHKPQQQKERK